MREKLSPEQREFDRRMEGGRPEVHGDAAHEELCQVLRTLGCHRTGNKYVLDGFDTFFYLIFDTAMDLDAPKPGTCDILVSRPGESPHESSAYMRLVADAKPSGVLRFLAALGISRFPQKTQEWFYTYHKTSVLREQ